MPTDIIDTRIPACGYNTDRVRHVEAYGRAKPLCASCLGNDERADECAAKYYAAVHKFRRVGCHRSGGIGGVGSGDGVVPMRDTPMEKGCNLQPVVQCGKFPYRFADRYDTLVFWI